MLAGSTGRVFILVAGGALLLGDLQAQRLEIRAGSRVYRVDSRRREGRVHYHLQDLARVVGLELRERGGVMDLSGPGGDLMLVDGRPLVRSQDHYVLLSAPPWRRKRGEWYVPGDFVDQVLPLLIHRRLVRAGPGRYQIEELAQNVVTVRVSDDGDSLRLVFESSRDAPVRVRESDRLLAVEFLEFEVRPEFPDESLNKRLVSSLDFDARGASGTFRLYKGRDFGGYREFTLSDPPRKVIEIHAASGSGPGAAAGSRRATGSVAAPRGSLRIREAVTIDPGHGGQDQGTTFQEVLEKSLSLSLSSRLHDQLSGSGWMVMLTRNRDVDLTIDQRSALANYYQSRAFVSLHVGSALSSSTRGPRVYVHQRARRGDDQGSGQLMAWSRGQEQFRDGSRRLAEMLQAELNRLWGTENRVMEVPLAVLAPVTGPAVLVEAGFLSNPQDRELLQSPVFQSRVAAALGSALSSFLAAPAGSGAGSQ